MFNLAAGDISQTGSVELTEATRAPQPGPAMQYKAHDGKLYALCASSFADRLPHDDR